MRIDGMLARIGREPFTVSHKSTVDEAVRLMADKKTRALIILEGDEPAGIFTESDLVRTHVQFEGRPLTGVGIHEAMTSRLIVGETQHDIEKCLDIMTRTGVSCLPLVQDGGIACVLFLRDLLQHKIERLTAELNTLHEYLADLQDAGVD